MTTRPDHTLQRFAAGLLAVALFAGVWVTAQPTAMARTLDKLVIKSEGKTFQRYDGVQDELFMIRKVDPDMCRDAEWCDLIPVEIPLPDIDDEDEYSLRFRIDQVGGNDLDVYFWDNKQIKAENGKKEPGDDGYDPSESDYTDLASISDPAQAGPERDGWVELGRPDLIDYNFTVVNLSGFDEGYSILAEIIVEDITPPEEVLPPDFAVTPSPGPTTTFVTTTTTPFTPDTVAPPTTLAADPGLDSVIAISDPDLLAIEQRNLGDELSAPATPVLSTQRANNVIPDDPGALVLLLWLVMFPIVLLGGSTVLLLKRRSDTMVFE